MNGNNQINSDDQNMININKDFNIYNNNNSYIFQRNSSSSNIFSNSKRKFNLVENTPITSKNRVTIKNSFKNVDMSKLRSNFSTSDINPNKHKTRAFFGLNNNFNIRSSNTVNLDQNQSNQSNQYSDPMNNNNSNFRNSFQLKGNTFEKLDQNVNVNINEKIISSPFQSYQSYQKSKKMNNLNNRSNQSSNIGKRFLFDSKEKDKKNKNINNNF